ncbi:hypothetical protein [Myroides marinus]|uniref:hypothetical protein n=1 Tax=Myroides marinus TaxID=703342 RepID=UPI002575B919|nr:hypothetical protein [Myroides marinus]MDM1361173.1 hypothetical protein [Myroides marinus]MDM1368194.1 hypothetical protein [Myroides marinus]MDM1375055.1 hypothetical protein [Myroides marinus]MDM1383226.1 hypothetical protein [Myroides marinus]MDM1404519.1 hypothetical protein [Myroides marinus]
MNRLVVFFVALMSAFCSYGQSPKPAIEIKVLDSKVTDNSLVTVVLMNNSNDTYWFPWDISELAYVASVGSTYENQVYVLRQRVYNDKAHIDEPTLMSGDYDSEGLLKKWNEKLATKKATDYVVVKPKNFVQLRLPFKVVQKLAPAWYSAKEKIKDGGYKYYVVYNYNAKAAEQVLSPTLLEEVEKLGYKIYHEPLISNKVPIVKK